MPFTTLFTRLRIARLHRWAMLWLLWFARFLEAAAAFAPLSKQVEAVAHEWLDRIERRIFIIVLARAAPHLNPSARHTYGPKCKRGAVRRALMGSRLRRTLRSKDIFARVAALAHDINDLIAWHCRRVARGLTRLSPIRMGPDQERGDCAAAQPCALTLAADTS